MIAADDGIWAGNLNLADILFLIAFIVFCIALVFRVMLRPLPIAEVLITAGLACVALAWMVL